MSDQARPFRRAVTLWRVGCLGTTASALGLLVRDLLSERYLTAGITLIVGLIALLAIFGLRVQVRFRDGTSYDSAKQRFFGV